MEPIEPLSFKQLSEYIELNKFRIFIRHHNIRVIYKGNTIPQILCIYKYQLQDIINISAVYFLIDNKEIVYVGQTHNLYKRIMQHTDKKYNDLYWFPTEKTDLKTVEDYFIIAMKPKYNKTHEDIYKINENLLWVKRQGVIK